MHICVQILYAGCEFVTARQVLAMTDAGFGRCHGLRFRARTAAGSGRRPGVRRGVSPRRATACRRRH